MMSAALNDSTELDVLLEDNHLLAINKPALLPTMGARSGQPTLLDAARRYIARKYEKPGNVYLGVVSRLDAPVSGAVLLARTSKAAARLNEAFRKRQVEKVYWVAASGVPDASEGTLEHYLRKDERHRKVHVTHANSPNAQFARLHYRLLGNDGALSLLEVCLETGRKHQIRVQLAKIGLPILGDRKYGSRAEFPLGIALHSLRLRLEHPVRREPLEISAPLPGSWRQVSPLRRMTDRVVSS